MKIKEMENKLCEENLLKIYDRGSWKEYIGLKENRNFSYEQSYGIEKMEDGAGQLNTVFSWKTLINTQIITGESTVFIK